MAISRTRKEELLGQYTDLLENSRAVFLAEYGGLNVKNLETLRQEVRDAQGTFAVTKNTLLRNALEKAGEPVPELMLTGQTGASFAMGEAPALAKALVEYAKKEEMFTIKGGIFEGQLLSVDDVEQLAKMPSLDQLRGQLAGLVSAPARNLASVVASGVRQVVNVIDAYAKKEAE